MVRLKGSTMTTPPESIARISIGWYGINEISIYTLYGHLIQ